MNSLIALSAMAIIGEPAVEVLPVSFKSGSETLRGQIFVPKNRTAGQKLPAVIVTGAWFTIKEQMPTIYAKEFAKTGLASLVFDFRGFGDSEGKMRNVENPTLKAQDIQAAAAFLSKHPLVDSSRLSGFALCASTGYMANAINAGAPLKSMAVGALWVQDSNAVESVYGGKDAVANLRKIGQEAKSEFDEKGIVRDVPAAGPEGSSAIMQQAPYYTDPNRGMIPKWENRFALMSWEHWLTFDSLAPAKKLGVPTLVLHSDQAALPDMARKFHAELPGSKAIYWSSESHMEFYDSPSVVTRNVGLASKHFARFSRPMTDEEGIQFSIEQLAACVDAKAWESARDHFAESVEVDYTSLGGSKGKVKADDLIAGWKEYHAKFSEMRHVYFNFLINVSGNEAQARHEGMATLAHDGKRWTVGGEYVVKLRKMAGRWKADAITFNMKWQHGDR